MPQYAANPNRLKNLLQRALNPDWIATRTLRVSSICPHHKKRTGKKKPEKTEKQKTKKGNLPKIPRSILSSQTMATAPRQTRRRLRRIPGSATSSSTRGAGNASYSAIRGRSARRSRPRCAPTARRTTSRTASSSTTETSPSPSGNRRRTTCAMRAAR